MARGCRRNLWGALEPVIAFLLGMLYAGVLALVARGRSFGEVSVARVALAGAAIGLIPNVVVAVGSWLGPATLTAAEVLDPLFIFQPLSAMIAVATLLIARRAKPQVGDSREQRALEW